VVHETFHCSPGVEQRHSVVIDDIAVLIPRILLIARLKCIGRVNEVEIQVPDTESVETRLESRFDTFWPMVGVPQLRGNKNVLSRDPISGKSGLQRLPYLSLVPVSFRAIEVSKSGVQCVSCRGSRQGSVGNEAAEAEGGHVARSVVERHSRQPKISTFNHWVITFFRKTFD
jgi:hypothetical protein